MLSNDFDTQADEPEKRPMRERIMNGTIGFGLFTIAVTGLGALHEIGQDKAAAERKARLEPEQLELISEAARSDTCEMLHPHVQRICLAEQEEQALEADQSLGL